MAHNAGGVCQVPEYIKLSDEIGDWAGDIKKAKLPDAFLVDYVRVYDVVERKMNERRQMKPIAGYSAWLIASFLVIRWAGYCLEGQWRFTRRQSHAPTGWHAKLLRMGIQFAHVEAASAALSAKRY